MTESARRLPSLGLSLLLAFVLTGSAPRAHAQDAASTRRANQEAAQRGVRRLASLRLERERELLEFWSGLGEFERRDLERRVAAARDPRRARFEAISLQGFARARRQLQHPTDDGPLEAWFDLVDSVDLVVVPGVFAARDEGRGEAMTVSIDALWDSAIDHRDDEGVEVALLWIAPDGTELSARQEPAGVRALETGFEMYIRPPVGGAAVWSLVLEVRTAQGVVRSQGVDVECVAELAEVRERVGGARTDAASTAARVLRERLEGLERSGLRRLGGTHLATWLDVVDGEQEPPARYVTRAGEGGAERHPHWSLTEAAGASRVLVLLTGDREHPLDLLTGPLGDAWRAFAAADDCRVVAAGGLVAGRDVTRLREFIGQLRADGAEEVVVVARGDAGRVLPGELARTPLPGLTGLVLAETPGAYAPVRGPVGVPTLRIETEAETDAMEELAAAGEPRRTRATRSAPLPFAALATPELVRRWLGAQ